MKLKIFIAVVFSVILFSGCEDPIHVDTNTAAPRLVVDALLNWPKGSAGTNQKIKLSTTGNYYNTTVPGVSGATVFVTNSSNTVFDFLETATAGDYVCDTFIPQLNESYTLTIIYNGETLTANETMYATPQIDYFTQELLPGIGSQGDVYQLKAFFTDSAATDDYYLLRYQTNITAIPEFNVFDDEFFQGNQVFGLYQHEDLKLGDQLQVTLYGISERYMNYMTKLLNITQNVGPFNTPPANLRGNIINTTHPENYVLGYFSASESDTKTYTIQ